MTTSAWGKHLVQGVHHLDPLGGQPHDLAHIFAHRGVARRLHGPHQLDARRRLHHVHDAAAHAARHAGDDGLDHKASLGASSGKLQGSRLQTLNFEP